MVPRGKWQEWTVSIKKHQTGHYSSFKIEFMIGPIVYWNIKGLGTSRGRLKKLVKKFKPKVVALAETFVDGSSMGNLMRSLCLEDGRSNQLQAGKIWILWDNNVNVSIVRMSD